MNGFEDNFNAAGRRESRKKKVVKIAAPNTTVGTPAPVSKQMMQEASKGEISNQVRKTWNIDGFDNADGAKKLTPAQGAMIGFALLIILTGVIYGAKALSPKKA